MYLGLAIPGPDNLSTLGKLKCIPELARNNSLFMKQKCVLGKPSRCEIKSSHCLYMKKIKMVRLSDGNRPNV